MVWAERYTRWEPGMLWGVASSSRTICFNSPCARCSRLASDPNTARRNNAMGWTSCISVLLGDFLKAPTIPSLRVDRLLAKCGECEPLRQTATPRWLGTIHSWDHDLLLMQKNHGACQGPLGEARPPKSPGCRITAQTRRTVGKVQAVFGKTRFKTRPP